MITQEIYLQKRLKLCNLKFGITLVKPQLAQM